MSVNTLLYPNSLALNCSTIDCSGVISGGNLVAPIITTSNVECLNLCAQYCKSIKSGSTIKNATLTGATITAASNNVIARALWDTSGSGSVSVYASSAPTTGQVLTATSPTLATWQTPGVSVQNVTISLNTAQLATLNTVPVTILAAQGAGTLIIPLSYYVAYTYSTSPYSTGGTVSLKYTGLSETGASVVMPGLGDGNTTSYYASSVSFVGGGAVPYPSSPLTNLGLTLSSGSAITGGLGSYQIAFQYIVVTP